VGAVLTALVLNIKIHYNVSEELRGTKKLI